MFQYADIDFKVFSYWLASTIIVFEMADKSKIILMSDESVRVQDNLESITPRFY